jgi:hypothetical protein
MIRKLKEIEQKLYYYENNKKIIGVHSKITGNVSGLTGDVNGLRGNVNGLTGNVSELTGDVSELTGIATNIEGDIDLCKITEEERKKTINIEELIIKE